MHVDDLTYILVTFEYEGDEYNGKLALTRDGQLFRVWVLGDEPGTYYGALDITNGLIDYDRGIAACRLNSGSRILLRFKRSEQPKDRSANLEGCDRRPPAPGAA